MPIGFNLSDCTKLPFINAMMERVEPQEGQGILVKCLIKQTSICLSAFV